jgi:hypothetical protein
MAFSSGRRTIKNGEGGVLPTEILNRFYNLPSGLDELYSEVLRQSFDPNKSEVVSRFKSVMVVTKEPLSVLAHSDMYCGNVAQD